MMKPLDQVTEQDLREESENQRWEEELYLEEDFFEVWSPATPKLYECLTGTFVYTGSHLISRHPV